MPTHLIIPDCQVKPGHDYTYLRAFGNYIVKKRPDVIVNIGDFADMPSLSSYDKGKKSFEGRRYKHDVAAVHEAMDILLKPLRDLQARQRRNKDKVYKPRMVLTIGNHEHRINRAVENGSMLDVLLASPAFAPQVAKVMSPRRWLTVGDVLSASESTGAL